MDIDPGAITLTAEQLRPNEDYVVVVRPTEGGATTAYISLSVLRAWLAAENDDSEGG